MVYPHAVKAIKLGNKPIRDDVAGNMMAFAVFHLADDGWCYRNGSQWLQS